jgi:hypothetical protein
LYSFACLWIQIHKVNESGSDPFSDPQIIKFVVQEDQGVEEEQNDEITNLLLKHEKGSNKQPAAIIPGDESDSDNRSVTRQGLWIRIDPDLVGSTRRGATSSQPPIIPGDESDSDNRALLFPSMQTAIYTKSKLFSGSSKRSFQFSFSY